MSSHRALKPEEIKVLEANRCSADDWSAVSVAEGFDAARVRRVAFHGQNKVGSLTGNVDIDGAGSVPAVIADATLINCEIGNNVRITGVAGFLSSYKIGDGAVIANVGTMSTVKGATFGNGVELETHNEGGGREVRIFNELSSQIAYIIASHRYRPAVLKGIDKMIDDYIASVKSDTGTVGAGAYIANVRQIVDVNVGPDARVDGAERLTNGTILSEKAAPAFIGSGVMADGFIIGEGSKVDSGAVLTNTFVGQGVKIGRQFSSENSVFFANCEGFHSEAVAAFAGPYTVTHHRSTLLIAGMFSFYNAGSGTNQSNHMYKLGPVHQGRVERGAKTASFSYMLWPCIVGPFCVVMGKNMANFDTSEFPFSYITAEDGGTFLTPSFNLFTVGTRRDGEKWPSRDRRKGSVKRDLIHFEVFSPFVVGRMIQGEKALMGLYDNSTKEQKVLNYKGIKVKRLMLKHGAKNYASVVDMYLAEKILAKAEGASDLKAAFAVEADAVYSSEWADLSGLLVAQDRLDAIEAAIESGEIADLKAFVDALTKAWKSYEKDEWAWVRAAFEARNGKSVDTLTTDDLAGLAADVKKAKASFTKKILVDAEKEFDDSARMGFGLDGKNGARDADFEAVRGTLDGNSFVKKLRGELAELEN